MAVVRWIIAIFSAEFCSRRIPEAIAWAIDELQLQQQLDHSSAEQRSFERLGRRGSTSGGGGGFRGGGASSSW